MRFEASFVDVEAALKAGEKPADIITSRPSAWKSLTSPVPLDGAPLKDGQLGDNLGEAARVPLFPYLTRFDPASALAFAFQMGLVVAKLAPGAKACRVSLGQIVQALPPEGGQGPMFRFWMGVALEMT